MIDQKKLAVIHIVKKELHLSDDEYKSILQSAAGVTSAKDLDDFKFRKLMNYLVRDKRYRLAYGMTLKQKLFIQYLARDMGWDSEHLRNFIHKYHHVPDIEALNRKQATKVIQSLKAVLEHGKHKSRSKVPGPSPGPDEVI